MGNWTNGLLMTMAMRQRESDRLADERAFEDRMAADQRQWDAEAEAAVRHEELLDDLETRRDEELEAQADAAAEKQLRVDAAAWFGSTLDVAGLGLADLSESALPSDPEALLAMLQPPNLLVTGGSVDDGWAAAQMTSDLLGATLVGADLATVTREWGSQEESLPLKLADGCGGWHVVFLASLDHPSQHGAWVAAGLAEYRAEEEGAYSRRFPVMIGRGPTARSLELRTCALVVVAHAASGRVPATLRSWGGWLPRPRDTKTCPECAEEVKAAARRCRFCGYDFAPEDRIQAHEIEEPEIQASPKEPGDTVFDQMRDDMLAEPRPSPAGVASPTDLVQPAATPDGSHGAVGSVPAARRGALHCGFCGRETSTLPCADCAAITSIDDAEAPRRMGGPLGPALCPRCLQPVAVWEQRCVNCGQALLLGGRV